MLDDKEFFENNAMEPSAEEEEVESHDEDIDSVLEDDIGEVYEDKNI